MRKHVKIFLLVFLSVIFIFREYFFHPGMVLFPANLLMSFYNPWKTTWEARLPAKPLGFDNIRYFYPTKKIIKESVAHKELPLWNPYSFSGTPLLADGQSAILYPLTWLSVVLPTSTAFSLMVLFVPTIASIGMYFFLREIGTSEKGGIFGALTFLFSGFFSVWMEENPAVSHTGIWTIWGLLFLRRLFRTKKLIDLVGFIVSLWLLIVSGFLQISLYGLIIIFFYGLFLSYRKTAKPTCLNCMNSLWVGGIIVSILLSSLYLFPVIEAYQQSPREVAKTPVVSTTYLLPWTHIVTLLSPDFLGNPGTHNYYWAGTYYDKVLTLGAVAFIFLLYSLFSKKNDEEQWWWKTIGLVFLLGFSSPLTKLLYQSSLPIISSMLPSRIFYLFALSGSIVSAYGFEKAFVYSSGDAEKIIRRKILIVLLGMIGIMVFFAGCYQLALSAKGTVQEISTYLRDWLIADVKVSPQFLSTTIRNTGIAVVFSLGTWITIFMKKRQGIQYVVFLFLIGWGVYYSGKNIYASSSQFLYQPHPVFDEIKKTSPFDKVIAADEVSRIVSNIHSVFEIYSPEGLNPVFERRYGELVWAAMHGGIFSNQIPRIEVAIDPTVARLSPADQFRLTRLYQLLGISKMVRYQQSKFPNYFDDRAWKRTWDYEGWEIYQHLPIFPRAWVVNHSEQLTDPAAVIARLYSPEFNPTTTVILDQFVPLDSDMRSGSSTLTISEYRHNSVQLQTQMATPGIIVLADVYYPGWNAYIDGRKVQVMRANYAFRAVRVPAGTHTVAMRFEPQILNLAMIGTVCGICGMIGLLIFFRFQTRKDI